MPPVGGHAPKKCLVEDCRRPAAHLGLCLLCYSQAKKLVDSGKVTWGELEQMGLAEGSADTSFMRALKKKKQEDR